MVMPNADELDDLLGRLAEFITRHPGHAVFGPPATAAEVAAVESATGLILPRSYKRFLLHFNGGFISLHRSKADPSWDEASAAWNSNCLFGTDRLIAEYADQSLIWRADLGWPGAWPYLPFCHTAGQELLVFAATDPATGEGHVLDAWHEVWPQEWGVLYEGFQPLLAA
jgi:hypothetical protein